MKGGKPSKGDLIPMISRDHFIKVKKGKTSFEDLNNALKEDFEDIVLLKEMQPRLKLASCNLKFGQTLSNNN